MTSEEYKAAVLFVHWLPAPVTMCGARRWNIAFTTVSSGFLRRAAEFEK